MTIALPGDFGKPRPALIIQSDQLIRPPPSRCCGVGHIGGRSPIRTPIEPTPTNGLRKRSQVMVDKAMSVKRDKIGGVIGRLDPEDMLAVTPALAVVFAIA